jgi:hypothetical protein
MAGTGSRRDVKNHPRAGLSNAEFRQMVERCAEAEQITIKRARQRVLEVLRSERVSGDPDPLPETVRFYEEAKAKGGIHPWDLTGRFTSTAQSLLPLDLNSSP